MRLFNSAKCFIGFHDWTPWEFDSNYSCNQTQVCRRCSKNQSQTIHSWSEFEYISSDSCEQKCICERCDREKNRIEHIWDVWKYESPTSCIQVRFCRRCFVGKEERVPEQSDHSWGEPKKLNCHTAMVKCLRCKETDELQLSPPEHNWSTWEKTSGAYKERKCLYCGETENDNMLDV